MHLPNFAAILISFLVSVKHRYERRAPWPVLVLTV
jgi:hypothetical protein